MHVMCSSKIQLEVVVGTLTKPYTEPAEIKTREREKCARHFFDYFVSFIANSLKLAVKL